MGAVDVCIGHDDHLVVPHLVEVEVLAVSAADRRDQRLDRVGLQHAVEAGALGVENLASQRQNRLRQRVATLNGRAACRVALDNEQLALARVVRLAVLELVGHAGGLEDRLAAGVLACLLRGQAGARCLERLLDDVLRLVRMGVEPVAEFLVHHALYEGLRLGVAELRLRLAFELRVRQLHRDHRGQAFTHIVTGEIVVFVFEDVLVAGIPVDHARERRAEALLMGAALGGGDRVREGVHGFRICRRPLHGDLRGNTYGEVLGLDVDHIRLDRRGTTRLHQERHVVLDAVLVLVRDGLVQLLHRVVAVAGHFVARLVDLAHVGERDLESLVQERHLLESAAQGLEIVDCRLEDLRVCPERDRRAGGLVVAHRTSALERAGGMLVDVRLRPVVALSAHFDVHARGERVHHRDAHAVQTAGHRITAAAELAAGVQLRHEGLDAGLAFAGHFVDRNAPAVVDHANAVVGQDRHLDVRGIPGQRLVNRVVDDLIDQVVQASRTGGTDVHARANAHGLKPFEHAQVARVVMLGRQGVVQLFVVLVRAVGFKVLIDRIVARRLKRLRCGIGWLICHRDSFL